MSKSLLEHLALAPKPLRDGVRILLALASAPAPQREAALALIARDINPGLAQRLRDELPPPGSSRRALDEWAVAQTVEALGVNHGGAQWLRDIGRWPKDEEQP